MSTFGGCESSDVDIVFDSGQLQETPDSRARFKQISLEKSVQVVSMKGLQTAP